MASPLASPQGVDIVVEGEKVKEALGRGGSAKVVHLVGVAAEAAKHMFGCIGSDGDRPPLGQGHPLLLRTRYPFQLLMADPRHHGG